MARRLKSGAGSRASAEETGIGANRPVLAFLKGRLASLNPTDRRIADCVLADPEKVVASSIGDIKVASGASVGSIVGFCRRLGLSGFADFKIALARDLAQSGMPGGTAQHHGGSLLEKVFQFHTESLADTLKINPEATVERVVQVLEKARRIEFFGIGLSYPVAYTASSKFQLLGLPASAQFDSHMQLINATHLKAGDVGFGISLAGTTQETVQCLQVARAKGATTICLTNAMKSPITDFSDWALYGTPSEIKYFQAPLASRITQLAVLDALFVALAMKNKNKTAARLQASGEELLKWRLS